MVRKEVEEYEQKEVIFYSAMLNAWLNTRLERDKQLLGLSVTAIGLLVTLLRIVGVSSLLQFTFFSLALVAFLITVATIINILDKNSTHIENILNGSEDERETLKNLDKRAGISFIVGMVLIVIIGIHSAIIHLNQTRISMNQEIPSDKNPELVNDSWDGVAKLRPKPPKAVQEEFNTSSNPSNSSTSSDDTESNNVGNKLGGNN